VRLPPGAVQRVLPSTEAEALIALTREIADEELEPRAASYEEEGRFPSEQIALLGRSGLLGLPYAEEHGGGGQPYEVYLQVVEELASRWFTVALSVAVHSLSCFPLATFGSAAQQERWLPDMLGGTTLGAYALSESQSGSDAAALQTKAVRDGDAYVVDGTKAWITHAGIADFYTVMVRTSDDGAHGITCLLVDASTPGLSFAARERKMGLTGSPTASIMLDDARVDAERRIGAEGQGFTIALAALDAGRLGIAACSIGLAQAAYDAAVAYAKEREQFGRTLLSMQGIGFMLADMATAIAAGRALYLDAARRKDGGLLYSQQAAMAKLFCSDAAMKVTTDAVQVLGGYGYVRDYPVERFMREAKVLQIFEGTNQIQRLVISRHIAKS
jgi:alkylation response protein AidB-like acyl-CoA dehydrogenase